MTDGDPGGSRLAARLAAVTEDVEPAAPTRSGAGPVGEVVPTAPGSAPWPGQPAVVVPASGTRRRTAPGWRVRARHDALAATRTRVRDLVLEEVAPRLGAGLDDLALHDEVRQAIDRILDREDVSVPAMDRRQLIEEVLSDTLGYGPLDALLADETVSEIMCNGYDDVFVERRGLLVEAGVAFDDDEQYRKVIERIVSGVGRRVDESSPMVDARLPDGSRVNAIIPPLAIRGPVLTIRKFGDDALTAADLVEAGTYSEELAMVLEASVRGQLNILVSGGTGTGKTTNLNVMSSFIPANERIITIEDSAELQLQQRHVVNLEARPPNAEGRGEVLIRDLVSNALRMRPDRIIVGECRAAEALDMLQAMNTGHDGSMTTVHANSPRDALSRLETMVLMAGFDLPIRAIRDQVAAAIDLILQVERRSDGRRVVTALTEVQGIEGDVISLQDVFRFREGGAGRPGGPVATGLRPSFPEALRAKGVEIPASAFRAPREPEEVAGRGAGSTSTNGRRRQRRAGDDHQAGSGADPAAPGASEVEA